MPPVAGESVFTRLPARGHPTKTSAKTSTLVPPASMPKGNDRPSSSRHNSNAVSSFRERLLRANKPSPAELIAASLQKKPHRKSSIAPIFKPSHATSIRKGSGRQTGREHSPDSEPDGLIKKLKGHYQGNAKMLRKEAVTQLQQAHSDLSHKLRGTLKGETAFLAAIEKQNETLCPTLAQAIISYEEYGPTEGEVRLVKSSVGDLVTTAETQLSNFEADLNRLWAEWEAAEIEVEKVYRETLPDQDGQERPSGDTSRFTDTLARFRTAITKEIEDAKGEVDQLSEAAVSMMKDIEKDFRKQTVPDLHIYFQSIDEP